MELKTYYQEKLDNAQHKSERTKKKILHISILRVAIFFLGFIALCICYDQGGSIIGGILLCTLVPFLLLVKVHNRLFHQKDWYETSIRHYKAELASLENDHSTERFLPERSTSAVQELEKRTFAEYVQVEAERMRGIYPFLASVESRVVVLQRCQLRLVMTDACLVPILLMEQTVVYLYQ